MQIKTKHPAPHSLGIFKLSPESHPFPAFPQRLVFASIYRLKAAKCTNTTLHPHHHTPFYSRLAQLSGVDIPLFMTSSVPSRPRPCMDTSIFSTRGYRALCLVCSLEKTALRWLRISAVDGRTAALVDEKPGEWISLLLLDKRSLLYLLGNKQAIWLYYGNCRL